MTLRERVGHAVIEAVRTKTGTSMHAGVTDAVVATVVDWLREQADRAHSVAEGPEDVGLVCVGYLRTLAELVETGEV